MYSYITSVMNEIVKIILVAIILFFILKMDIYLMFFIVSVSNVLLSITIENKEEFS